MDCRSVKLTVVSDTENQSSDSSPRLQQMQLCAHSPPGAGFCYVPWLALMQGDPCSPQRNSYQLLVLDFSSLRDITDGHSVVSSVPLHGWTAAAQWNDWVVRSWQRLTMSPRRRWMQWASKHTVTPLMKESMEHWWAFARIILNLCWYSNNCGSHVTNGLIHKNSERLKKRKVFFFFCVSATWTLTSACAPSWKWHFILLSFPQKPALTYSQNS